MRNHDFLRNVTLGTSLTALFLLVRCSVPERDYTPLGIRENGGSGGASDSAGDGVLLGSAGRGGLDGLGDLGDAGGLGGQGGEMPIAPIPCVPVRDDTATDDAGPSDAGPSDAGPSDAGSDGAACECVDGFIRAVDADHDGDGSRACSVAPGLDCDDGDGAVTHNSCGGCSALPNAIGEGCLECGSYICAGPDALACASKPGPVEDPDCRCLNALIVARDTDGDGQGTRLCEQNPGSDCNDGDDTFVSNACGGCESLPGTVGAACNQCGAYTCSGTALVCAPSGGAGGHCLNTTTRQTCVGNGFWGGDTTCGNVCYQGNCEVCTPGTFRCTFYTTGDAVSKCVTNAGSSSSLGIGWASWGSCSGALLRCNPTDGSCTTGYLLLPRDETFDVVPLQRPGLPWHDILNTASDSDYG